MVLTIAVHKVFSRPIRGLAHFANSCDILWIQPTIFRPSPIATVLHKFLPWFYVLLSQQHHSSLIEEALMYNDSLIILHRLCKIPRSCLQRWFSAFLMSRDIFVKVLSVSWEVFVLQRSHWIHRVAESWITTAHRYVFPDSHPSLRTLWSAVIKSPNVTARSTVSPVRLLQGALVILAFLETLQFRSFGKGMKIMCLLDATFLEGSRSDSREVLMGVSLDADTPWVTRFSVKSSHHSDKPCNKLFRTRAMSFCSCSDWKTRTFVGLEAHLPTLGMLQS